MAVSSSLFDVRGVREGLLVLATFFWGATFVLVDEGIEGFPVFGFLAIRFGIAAALMLPLLYARRRAFRRSTLRSGVLLGLLMFTTYGLQTAGLLYTSVANSGLITGLYVVFAAVFEAIFFGARIPRGAWIGVGFATGGLWLLAAGGASTINLGDVLTLGAAMAIALHISLTGRFVADEDPALLTVVQLVVVATLSTLGSAAFETLPGWPPQATWEAAIFCAVFATVVAYWIQTAVQQSITPMRTALIFTLEPVFALAAAIGWAGEVLSGRAALGALLVLGGIALAEWRRTRAEA